LTFIFKKDGILFLIFIIDRYSTKEKKVIGYNVSNSLNASGSIQALEMVIKNRKDKNKGQYTIQIEVYNIVAMYRHKY